MGNSEGIFADNAQHLRSHGLAVLPCKGKRPVIRWRTLRKPLGKDALEQLAEKHPAANIGVVPGLSGLFVADVDDANQVGDVEHQLGATPFRVRSARGVHLYYRAPTDEARVPGHLRSMGLNVDIKAGRSIVIFPPSMHQSGVPYAYDHCGLDALRDLPPPKLAKLLKTSVDTAFSDPGVSRERVVEGYRGTTINRWLCREAPFCETFDGLLAIAHDINDDFMSPKLSDAEIMKRARDVWKGVLAGRIVPWVGGKAIARSNASEMKELCHASRNGPDAFMLLMFLQTQHGARCRRGNTFFIAAAAMQKAGSLPGWSQKRIAAAREILLGTGKIIRVSSHRLSAQGRMQAAQYRFAGRV